MTKKTLKRAEADIGLIFCAFNLRRIFNILDKEKLKAYLKALDLLFPMFLSQKKANRGKVDFTDTKVLIKKDFAKAA